MPGTRSKPGAAGELVRRAARRLEQAWQHPVAVGDVLVATPERSVFRTHAPDGSPVIVKASTRQQRADAGQAERLSLLLGRIFGSATEPERYCVLHGDPQPAHFLLSPAAGIAALIDFGDACTGDPVWDLAVLALDDPLRLGDVLAGYAPSAPLRDRIRAMIGPYRLLRWLGEANWLHEHGLDPKEPLAALRQALAAYHGNAAGDG